MPFTATNANIEKDQPFVFVSLNMLLRETRGSITSDESDAPAAAGSTILCISSRHALPIQIPHFRMRDVACRESDIKWQNFIVLDVFVFDIGSHFAAFYQFWSDALVIIFFNSCAFN